jgi:uncharacterized OB-fold protein
VTGFRVERDDASAAFFDAAATGVLLLRRCPVCGETFTSSRPRCAHTDDLEWVPAAGTGALVTWAVDHAPPLDPVLAAPDGLTSVFGIVELDEGPWIQVAIVGTDPAGLREGTPMRVEFVRPGEGETIPVFTPVESRPA